MRERKKEGDNMRSTILALVTALALLGLPFSSAIAGSTPPDGLYIHGGQAVLVIGGHSMEVGFPIKPELQESVLNAFKAYFSANAANPSALMEGLLYIAALSGTDPAHNNLVSIGKTVLENFSTPTLDREVRGGLQLDFPGEIKEAKIQTAAAMTLLGSIVKAGYEPNARANAAKLIRDWRSTPAGSQLSPSTLLPQSGPTEFEGKVQYFDRVVLTAWAFDVIGNEAAGAFFKNAGAMSVENLAKIVDFSVKLRSAYTTGFDTFPEQTTALYIESRLHSKPQDTFAKWFAPDFDRLQKGEVSPAEAGQLLRLLGMLDVHERVLATLAAASKSTHVEVREGAVRGIVASPISSAYEYLTPAFRNETETRVFSGAIQEAMASKKDYQGDLVAKRILNRITHTEKLSMPQKSELFGTFLTATLTPERAEWAAVILTEVVGTDNADAARKAVVGTADAIRALLRMALDPELEVPTEVQKGLTPLLLAAVTSGDGGALVVDALPALVDKGVVTKEKASSIIDYAQKSASPDLKALGAKSFAELNGVRTTKESEGTLKRILDAAEKGKSTRPSVKGPTTIDDIFGGVDETKEGKGKRGDVKDEVRGKVKKTVKETVKKKARR
jgi:hypothetical protein